MVLKSWNRIRKQTKFPINIQHKGLFTDAFLVSKNSTSVFLPDRTHRHMDTMSLSVVMLIIRTGKQFWWHILILQNDVIMYEYFAAWCPCVTVLRDYSPETLSSTCHLISEPTLHPKKEDINNGEGRRTGKAELRGQMNGLLFVHHCILQKHPISRCKCAPLISQLTLGSAMAYTAQKWVA